MSTNREDAFTRYTKLATDAGFASKFATASTAATINALRNDAGVVKISGSTVAIALNGVSAGVDGQRLVVYQAGTGAMTVANEATAAAAANRILTLSGATATTGTGAVELIYDSAAQRWICISLRA